jgi:hypothetical protein
MSRRAETGALGTSSLAVRNKHSFATPGAYDALQSVTTANGESIGAEQFVFACGMDRDGPGGH